jgi:hydroxyethylthiazole kinase
MDAVTGTGCILSAITAAFYSVSDTPFEAAAAACAVSAIAGELAAQRASGPGTFLSHFMDALYTLDQATIKTRLKADFYRK